ncbi:hypothetical protein M427DRAFT_28921 [Gonapodya prolifera JEL478]|uniref:G-protein coupled receptors family 2 profile 2 domain-containing protein n=1 Tax=Gonapodya prolifera (strain JEL478) TaxID=1344416 RepID=A0A139ARU1_GONPJ|nr:hypothetical protein M427DRAFT_28921 [Gonapodya prolifera JEL478]|eukprot:KXS19466.1 hypothetical protein M427DRAFT_28921 [Gonapodya prolifera JEL478]
MDDWGDAVAIRNGNFTRGQRAIWIIPVTALTTIGGLSVLIFYAIAFGARLPILKHPLHKLIIFMFSFNVTSGLILYGIGFVDPNSPACHTGVFVVTAGITGDYCTSFAIYFLLFHSLVLHARRSQFMENAILSFPIGSALVFAFLTIGGTGPMDRDGACWVRDMLGWRAIVTYTASAFFAVSTMIMGVFIIRSLVPRLPLADTLRVPQSGMLSVGNTMREDTNVITKRLVWYPITTLICVGGGALVDVAGGKWGMVVGEQLLMGTGFINSIGFFAFDPTFRSVAKALLEEVNSLETAFAPPPDMYHHTMDPRYAGNRKEEIELEWERRRVQDAYWGVKVARSMKGLLKRAARV